MPHEFDYEAAKAIFHGSNLHEVRADGVWLLSENIAPLLTSAEHNAFIERPLDSLWEMGKPSPSSQPVLRIPFTAADLAACFAVGAGALFAVERFGGSDEDLDESLEKLNAAPAAKAAVRAAYAELRGAVEFVGALDVRHEEDAQRRTQGLEETLRKVRKRLGIDAKLARVDKKLAAELANQESRLNEMLAPLKKGVEAGDEASIRQTVVLRKAAEEQASATHDAANLKRGEIRLALDKWKAQDIGYRDLRKAVADAWTAAKVAEGKWNKEILNHLIGEQAAAEMAGQVPTSLVDQADAQSLLAPHQDARTAQSSPGPQPVVATTEQVAHTEVTTATWFIKPRVIRDDGLSGPVHQVLMAAHKAGALKPPSPRDVLESFRSSRHPGIVRVNSDDCDFSHSSGKERSASLQDIRRRIEEITRVTRKARATRARPA